MRQNRQQAANKMLSEYLKYPVQPIKLGGNRSTDGTTVKMKREICQNLFSWNSAKLIIRQSYINIWSDN